MEVNTLFGKDIDLALADKYLNNVTSDLQVTLLTQKPQ